MAEVPQQDAAPVSRDPSRLGGAAADFVAGLGRKVVELRAALEVLADAPERERGRDELRRKLHALGVGARLLHFDVLARAIHDATSRMDEETVRGQVSDALLDELSKLLNKLPDLAWSKTAPTPTPPPAHETEPLPEVPPPVTPWTVLVVGAETLGQALGDDPAGFPCEIERTDDPSMALELARTVAPEVLVVDVDLDGSIALIEALVEDPLTMPVPIVAFGALSDPAVAARLVALGVTRVVSKPSSAAELRALCRELVEATEGSTKDALHPELGDLTVGELADRLADEVRKALIAIDPGAAASKIALGMGAEILGPIWGALARVRDVVESKSHGAVAFPHDRARGAFAVTAFADEEPPPSGEAHDSGVRASEPSIAPDRRVMPRAAALQFDLASRIIVIADDDPAVVWFIADVLRGAGALVLEARDGGEALALTRGSGADAVISDVLMPRVDGLTLARNLRRDVALRDRPIMLLSWKEDLLKRLRDLRMESQAMLRKESDGRTILARVREILSPRIRVEHRIATGGEVRGRLDDLSVSSLLEITNRVRREATIVVRDAANVFEVELDGGGLRNVSRAGIDGSLVRGEAAVASLLGVVGGRFLVRPPASERAAFELEGDLTSQLGPVLRRIRGACDAVSGARTVEVIEVGLEPTLLSAYLKATPPPVRMLLEALAAGASPRHLILGGEVAPSTLEDVLLDVASRGMVVRARGHEGDDLLAAAEKALDLPPLPLVPPGGPSKRSSASDPHLEFSLESIAPPPKSSPIEEAGAPGSLTDAVLQASADKRPSQRPIIDMRELKPRSVPTRSDPPPAGELRSSAPREAASTPAPAHAVEAAAENKPAIKTLPPPERIAESTPPKAEATAQLAEVAEVAPVPERLVTLVGVGKAPTLDEAVASQADKPAKTESTADRADRAEKLADSQPRVVATTRERSKRDEEVVKATGPLVRRARALEDDEDDEDDLRARRRAARRAREDLDDDDDDRPSRRARRRDRDEDDALAAKPAQRRRASDLSPERTRAAAKQLKSDATFWWVVLAIGLAGIALLLYMGQSESPKPNASPGATSQPSAQASTPGP